MPPVKCNMKFLRGSTKSSLVFGPVQGRDRFDVTILANKTTFCSLIVIIRM